MNASKKNLIRLDGVSWLAGGRPVLRDVSWTIRQGEHWAILGDNGSGKTSLLRMATGFLRPNAGGTVSWQGTESVELRRLRRSIGWVTAALTASVPPRERVLELVVSGRHAELGLRPPIRQAATAAETNQATGLLSDCNCEELAERRFAELSQGEQQKVLLARALMALPLLLILDEPCVGLDPGAREQFLETLDNVLSRPQSPTLVFVTHQIEEILPAIKNVLVMSQGEVSRHGSSVDVLTADVLGRIYGKSPTRIESHHGRYWPIW